MTSMKVDIDNFVRAETSFQFDRVLAASGDVNRWYHVRGPVPIDRQNVIRMQRDTLYSSVVVDVSRGATLSLPDTEGRYRSVAVINEDHYTNDLLHEAGTYELTVDRSDTPYAYLIMRILADPNNPEDLETVHQLQDSTLLEAESAAPYSHPDYDEDSYKQLYANILALGEAKPDAIGSFGPKDKVNPVRHLIDTALGWGGLPEHEAHYMGDSGPRPVGRYSLSLRDAPADAFWSLSIYNRNGFFEKNPAESYNMNSVVAEPNPDGSFTLNLAPEKGELTNYLYVMDGWNYVFRLYHPRPEVFDGTWHLPEFIPTE